MVGVVHEQHRRFEMYAQCKHNDTYDPNSNAEHRGVTVRECRVYFGIYQGHKGTYTHALISGQHMPCMQSALPRFMQSAKNKPSFVSNA